MADPSGASSCAAFHSRRNVVYAVAVTVVSVLPVFLVGAHAVQLRESLGFNQAALGGAAASFLLSMAIASVFCGRIADRIGPSSGMRSAAVIATAASLWLAVVANSLAALVLGLVVCGIANALAQSSASLLLATSVRAGRQGIAFGAFQSAKPAATMLAGLSVPVLGLQLGWRSAFVAAAVLAAVVAVLSSFHAAGGSLPSVQERMRISSLPLILMTVGIGFGFAVVNSLATFLVDAATAAGFSPSTSGLLLALGGGLAVAGRLVVGQLADRRGLNQMRTVAVMLLIGGVGHGLLATQVSEWMVLGVVLACAAGWAFSGLFFLAMVRMHSAAPGAIAGVALAGGSLGGAIGPAAFGLIVEHTSYTLAWLSSGAWAVVAATAILAGSGREHRMRSAAGM